LKPLVACLVPEKTFHPDSLNICHADKYFKQALIPQWEMHCMQWTGCITSSRYRKN